MEGDIKSHTKIVLDQIQKNLELAGSSMEKVLKCNVYLNDLKDYAGMNEVYQGSFGADASRADHDCGRRRNSRQLSRRNRRDRLHLSLQDLQAAASQG